jgi:hypothetical protein
MSSRIKALAHLVAAVARAERCGSERSADRIDQDVTSFTGWWSLAIMAKRQARSNADNERSDLFGRMSGVACTVVLTARRSEQSTPRGRHKGAEPTKVAGSAKGAAATLRRLLLMSAPFPASASAGHMFRCHKSTLATEAQKSSAKAGFGIGVRLSESVTFYIVAKAQFHSRQFA